MKANAIKRRFFMGGAASAAISAIVGRFARHTPAQATSGPADAPGNTMADAQTDAPADTQEGLLWAVTFDGQIDSLGTADDAPDGPVEVYADQAEAEQAALALVGPGVAVTDEEGCPATVAVRPIAWRFVGPPVTASDTAPRGSQALKPGPAAR